MRARILAGLAASLTVLAIPGAILGMGWPERPVTQRPEAAQTPAPSERRVQAIVIHQAEETVAGDAQKTVTVCIDGVERQLSLSDYLLGVLMGEMPADFPLEAMKAQAVAARTYTLRRLEQGGVLSDDPAECQAYDDPETAETRYGTGWEEILERYRRGVAETDGQVLTYDGELIAATYFSCSGGRTESAQAVWGGAVPYLVSVESPGEEGAAAYESQVTLDMADFLGTLDISSPAVGEITYTEGGGVDTMEIGGKTFAGTELRSLLNLRSTCFTMEITADQVTFTVRGFGHRVGMSQYGAKAMAEAGASYEEILERYYPGTELEKAP